MLLREDVVSGKGRGERWPEPEKVKVFKGNCFRRLKRLEMVKGESLKR